MKQYSQLENWWIAVICFLYIPPGSLLSISTDPALTGGNARGLERVKTSAESTGENSGGGGSCFSFSKPQSRGRGYAADFGGRI